MGILSDLHNDLERGAFQLIVEYRARLHAAAVMLCGDNSSADDLVFRTFEKVLSRADSYKDDVNLFGWMMTIMTNIHRDDMKSPVVRGTKTVAPEDLEQYAGADWSTDEQILRNSDCEAVRAALSNLDPKYRQVLIMRYYEDLSLKEIASFLKKPVGTVGRRIYVALHLLAGKLEAEFGKAKKPLAVLGALILSATTIFGAIEAGVVDAVKAYFTSETPASATETPSASPASVVETPVEDYASEAAASTEPPVTQNDEVSGGPTSSTTFENRENTETKKEEPMKLTKTLKSAAVAAVMSVGSACAEPMLFYVDANSTGAVAPYSTWGTAATRIADALAAARTAVVTEQSAASAEIRIKSGTAYVETGFTLDFPVAIIGDSGNPEDVEIVDQVSKSRAFAITHADAVVKDLTISGTGWSGGSGSMAGHIYMTGGTVEHCIVKDGIAFNGIYGQGSGGNIWMSGGRVLRCQILGGMANYCYGQNGQECLGDGIYAQGGLIENCLVAKNGHAQEKHYGGGIYAKGNAWISNCTVVDNLGNGCNGIYSDSASVKIVNTVIFGNGTGEFRTDNYKQCFSHCASSVTNDACATWHVIESGDFVSYITGDYRLSAATALINAGTRDEAWLPTPQATQDLDGFMRVSGAEIDIGCYEFDLSKVSISGYASTYAAFETSNIVFHAAASGGTGSGFEYQWDFGNGESAVTELSDYSYAYPTSGLFRVRVTAREQGSAEWLPWFEPTAKMVIAPATMFVDSKCETPTFPYKTKATAALSIADALCALTNNVSEGRPAIPGAVICICKGSHGFSNIALNAPVTIKGETGNPKDVTIVAAVNDKRAFTITHADAKVMDLTISGRGCLANGGHVNMTAGTIENCIIAGGRAGSKLYGECYGGNVWMSGGRLVRCQIVNGSANGIEQDNQAYGRGDGVYASGSSIIENCLFITNSLVYQQQKAYGGAIYAKDSAKIINCTVVSNGHNAVYLDSANARVVNTVLFGNGGTLATEFGSFEGAVGRTNQFSHCASTVANGGDPDCRVIDEKAFWHYDRLAEGVKFLRAAPGSKLISGGTKLAEYEAAGAISMRDLLGGPRLVGRCLDIGAIEGAAPGMAVRVR